MRMPDADMARTAIGVALLFVGVLSAAAAVLIAAATEIARGVALRRRGHLGGHARRQAGRLVTRRGPGGLDVYLVDVVGVEHLTRIAAGAGPRASRRAILAALRARPGTTPSRAQLRALTAPPVGRHRAAGRHPRPARTSPHRGER